MKHLAVALIVVALIAATFGADLWMDEDVASSYGKVSGVGLVLSILWFLAHLGDES